MRNAKLFLAMALAAKRGERMPIPPVQPWVIEDIKFLGEYWAAIERRKSR